MYAVIWLLQYHFITYSVSSFSFRNSLKGNTDYISCKKNPLIHLCDFKPLNIETDTVKLNATVTLVNWLTLIISWQFVFKKIYFIFNKSNLNDLDKKEKENMQCIKTDNQFLIDIWKILKQRYNSHLTLCFLQSKIEIYPSTNPMVCRWACCSFMF